MTSPGGDSWHDAVLAAHVLAIAPQRLGGLRIQAPAGPAREAYVRLVTASLGETFAVRRVPLAITEEALVGGTDLAATLQAGRIVRSTGLLTGAGALALIAPMAERMEQRVAGLIARALDQPRSKPLVCLLLDDGREPEEAPPPSLCDRLALNVDLRALHAVPEDGAPMSASRHINLSASRCAKLRQRAARVVVPEEAVAALCMACLGFGIASARAGLFAVQVARISAALHSRPEVSDEDIALAARLVLGPRATRVPAETAADEGEAPEPPEAPDREPDTSNADGDTPPEQQPARQGEDLQDAVIAAARATLPPGLLAQSSHIQRAAARRNGASGAVHAARRRGRPIASRPGHLSDGRIDVLATVKAAAPWQKLRTPLQGAADRIAIRRSDIHIRRMRERSASLTIFVVDASGSTASQRLAEAKGAVEMLLAECYVRRDQVALISFRKSSAEVLLPPTRSLVRAKRMLAEMPSGGGTPFAAAIAGAADLAQASQRAGLSPLMVFLTDGGANITRDGLADRTRAEAEARGAARSAAAMGHKALLIDVSFRDRPFTREISSLLGARYVNLPRADAESLARTVAASAARK